MVPLDWSVFCSYNYVADHRHYLFFAAWLSRALYALVIPELVLNVLILIILSN